MKRIVRSVRALCVAYGVRVVVSVLIVVFTQIFTQTYVYASSGSAHMSYGGVQPVDSAPEQWSVIDSYFTPYINSGYIYLYGPDGKTAIKDSSFTAFRKNYFDQSNAASGMNVFPGYSSLTELTSAIANAAVNFPTQAASQFLYKKNYVISIVY